MTLICMCMHSLSIVYNLVYQIDTQQMMYSHKLFAVIIIWHQYIGLFTCNQNRRSRYFSFRCTCTCSYGSTPDNPLSGLNNFKLLHLIASTWPFLLIVTIRSIPINIRIVNITSKRYIILVVTINGYGYETSMVCSHPYLRRIMDLRGLHQEISGLLVVELYIYFPRN